MNKKDSILILTLVVSVGLVLFLFCYYCATSQTVVITDKYINSLDINSGSEELHKLGSGLSKEVYKAILVGIGVYSNIRYKDLGIDNLEKDIKDKNKKTDKDFIDIFCASLNNLLFKYKNGVSKILNEDEPIFKYIKSFLEKFITKDTLQVTDQFKEYIDKYNIVKEKVYKLYNKDVLDILDNTKVSINIKGTVEEFNVGDVTWGMYLEYFASCARLPLN